MRNIHDLTNLLRAVRIDYQETYKKAVETKKQELATLQRDYVRNTPTYAAKEQEIQFNFDVAAIKARERAAKKASEEIEDLREWEKARVGRIDETALSKINSLRGGPLTTAELKQVLANCGSSNYWVQKAVSSLAEENGIPVTELPLGTSLDVKLSVISQLEEQFNKMLEYYDPSPKKVGREFMEARFLYLNDDILQNAVNIYTGGVQDLSEADAVTRAYYKIKAMSGQTSKACAITNSLRNLKKQDAKNMLLYQLAKDNTIRNEAYEVAGISDIMAEWKGGGKAERYAKAFLLADELKNTQDVEKIESRLRGYAERVKEGLEPVNEFTRGQITKAYKKNSFISKALEGLTATEKDWLFGDTGQENTVNGIEVSSLNQNKAEQDGGNVTE